MVLRNIAIISLKFSLSVCADSMNHYPSQEPFLSPPRPRQSGPDDGPQTNLWKIWDDGNKKAEVSIDIWYGGQQ